MNARVTAAERAALPVARAALESQASAYGMADTIVFALGGAQLLQCPETAAELAALRADADRLKRVAEREHKAFLDTHNALNLLREDANRVMAEHGVQAQQAELERVREKAIRFKEQRGERTRFLATVSADLERANARVTELETERHSTNEALSEAAETLRAQVARIAALEQQLTDAEAERADRHDDLAGALGYANEDWADLISIAAANTATTAKGDARVRKLEQQLAAATGATYREGARLLEATGRDDDAVNLLDNMADAHQPGGTAAAPVPGADRVVAYRSLGGRVLRCLAHAPIDLTGFVPVTSEGLPDGGICTQLECGRDLLITPAGGVL